MSERKGGCRCVVSSLRGIAETDGQEFDQAILSYQRILLLNAKNWETYKDLGWSHWRLDQYELAIYSFYQAIELNHNANPLCGKASSLSYLGKHVQAISLMNEAQETDPSRQWSMIENVRIYQRGRRDDDALEAINKAALQHPKSDSIWNWRGDILSDLGQNDDAIKNYEMATVLDPMDKWNQSDLAWPIGISVIMSRW
jgi:tetratricopeptide (TPR) repeat protein